MPEPLFTAEYRTWKESKQVADSYLPYLLSGLLHQQLGGKANRHIYSTALRAWSRALTWTGLLVGRATLQPQVLLLNPHPTLWQLEEEEGEVGDGGGGVGTDHQVKAEGQEDQERGSWGGSRFLSQTSTCREDTSVFTIHSFSKYKHLAFIHSANTPWAPTRHYGPCWG